MNDDRSAARPHADRTASAPLTDDALGALVRDVADQWTMPPLRLDAPGWRDQVRSPRARRLAAVRGGLGRGARLVGAAVALTVVVAVAGAILTSPDLLAPTRPSAAAPGVGASAAPTGTTGPSGSSAANPSSTPMPTFPPRPTPLPALAIDGPVPNPSLLLVERSDGAFGTADLATGTRVSLRDDTLQETAVMLRPDGTVVCLCATGAKFQEGGFTSIAFVLQRFGADPSTTELVTFEGAPDPRDVGLARPDNPPHVLISSRFSADGRDGYIGWSARKPDGWHSGLIRIDVATGVEVGRTEFPVGDLGTGDDRLVVDAPRVIGEGPDGVIVARGGWGYSVKDSASGFETSTVADLVSFQDGPRGVVTPLTPGEPCGDWIDVAGATANGGHWLACRRQNGSQTVIRHLAADGSLVRDTAISWASLGVEGSTTTVSPDGRYLFEWDPMGRHLTRVDIETGDVITGSAPTAAADPGLLGAIAGWLVPTVNAKMLLQTGIAVSPDGTRVYTLGMGGSIHEPTGSSGIDVFDAATLTHLDHWDATADFVSIAVSGDGATVYAAGMPGVDAKNVATDQPASITAFDATTGTPRVIAGDLGQDILVFASPLAE